MAWIDPIYDRTQADVDLIKLELRRYVIGCCLFVRKYIANQKI